MSKNSAAADTGPTRNSPRGTTPAFARMHKWLKRFIIICLFGLVIEGAFTVGAGDLVRRADAVSDRDLRRVHEGALERREGRMQVPAPDRGPAVRWSR